MENFEKRFVTTDGKFRLSVIREEYPENPRNLTDMPVYFEDYSREYSVMLNGEKDSRYNNISDRAYYLLANYADTQKVVDLLIENGKHLTDGKKVCNNALEYNRETKEWDLLEAKRVFNDTNTYWQTINSFDCKKVELPEYIYEIAEGLTESSLEYIYSLDIFTIRVATYKFRYYGGMTFTEGLNYDGDGLCWIEKKEYMKYTGISEDQWKAERVSENWLVKEVASWADNEVFGFVTEKRVDYDITKVCTSEEKETENYSETEWDQTDSCWGFYGYLNEVLDDILDNAGYTLDELTETNE